MAVRSEEADMPAHSPSILLVDDCAAARGLLRMLLEHTGAVVFEAANGIEALRVLACQQITIDLVATDVHMPELDGFGLVRAIRERTHTGRTPALLLHSADAERHRVEAKALRVPLVSKGEVGRLVVAICEALPKPAPRPWLRRLLPPYSRRQGAGRYRRSLSGPDGMAC